MPVLLTCPSPGFRVSHWYSRRYQKVERYTTFISTLLIPLPSLCLLLCLLSFVALMVGCRMSMALKEKQEMRHVIQKQVAWQKRTRDNRKRGNLA
jgi:hypothetical protein